MMSKGDDQVGAAGDYKFGNIEPKWQDYWLKNKTFKTSDDFDKPKYYVLDMFPYPSGDGLHVGHPEGYTATDIVARYKRMNGFNVLHPMGWDAFGLPAEQHAMKTGTHPKLTTKKNIDNFRKQIRALGLSYDWDREIDTTDPKYYKWTQWIFQQLYKKDLAYEVEASVNWCPELGTVLANEEVINGKSEVGSFEVVRKPMKQWTLKITHYAERLLDDLNDLDWPEAIKEMQRNWIGKSTGANVKFSVDQHDHHFEVFTTRPDTLFGATFVVLSPEHPLVSKIVTASQKNIITDYISKSTLKNERDRIANTDKTGVFTGAYAINPVNQQKIPIWISDYVLMSYGSGAIMAVPGHDERDHEFARKFDLPIIRVITGGEPDINQQAHSGDGQLVNSGFIDGLSKKLAIVDMIQWLETNKVGEAKVTYKLRDWLFARQRYWGEPFPLAKDSDGNVMLIEENDLPVSLPELEEFRPSGTGESPLALATDWLDITGKDGKKYRRETNTMPQWAGSCWYFLRFIDPDNAKEPWAKEKENYWMPVDLYVGGAEHAVLHLLYARFWHKVFYDLKLVSTKEPFQKLVNQGMILGENGEKMSKSRGNVVNPDHVIAEWGADAMRLYEMFMGPLEAAKPWNTQGISGVYRFLQRVWRLIISEDSNINDAVINAEDSTATKQALHRTISKVTDDLDHMRFNTAISAMMEFVNFCYKEKTLSRQTSETLVLLVAPFAPHIAEELWERLGHQESLSQASWPTFELKLIKDDSITMSIQVNGKLRGTIDLALDADKEDVLKRAKTVASVARHLEGKNIIKEVFVPKKIINFVVR
jgi:leucyl-tRNA synthetase